MDVRCDRCETEYELDDAIVTDGGASVQCTTCGHTFTVTRRPSSPLNRIGMTPPGGVSEPVGPEVPEWTLSTDDGKVHRFRDLNTLQKWIVERKVGRSERISRAGGPWLSLGDVVELTPFFNVVDEADRARASAGLFGGMPTAPTFPSSAGWRAAPVAPPASGPIPSGAGTPPPAPLDARRPVSEDGPTVPNRLLPGLLAISAPSGRAPVPLPGVRGSEPANRGSGMPSPGRRTPDPRGTAGSGVHNAPVQAQPPSPRPLAPAVEGVRPPPAADSARPETSFGPNITTETHALESELLRHGHRGRNVVFLLTILSLAAAGGGYWWWSGLGRSASTMGGDSSPVSPAVTMPTERTAPIVAATNSDHLAEGTGRANEKTTPPAGEGGAGNRVSALAASGGAPAASGAGPVAGARPRPPVQPSSPVRGSAHGGTEVAKGVATLGGGAGVGAGASYDRLVAEADKLLEHGKSAKADKLYAQALAARPDGVAALTGAAYVLLDRQRHFKAIETFRQALSIQPTFGPALFGIAESYRARGDSAQALGAYRQYLAIAPTGADAPAARRQIKELESAGGSPPSGDRSSAEAPAADQAP